MTPEEQAIHAARVELAIPKHVRTSMAPTAKRLNDGGLDEQRSPKKPRVEAIVVTSDNRI